MLLKSFTKVGNIDAILENITNGLQFVTLFEYYTDKFWYIHDDDIG